MITRQQAFLCGLLLIPSALLHAEDRVVRPFSYVEGACTEGETWVLSKGFSAGVTENFREMLAGSRSAVTAITDVLLLKQNTQKDPEREAFADYWRARILYREGLYHNAHTEFARLGAPAPTPQTIGIRLAAIECLANIHYRYPRLHLTPEVAVQLPLYPRMFQGLNWMGKNQEVIWQAASIWARVQMTEPKLEAGIERTLGLLRGAGPYESLVLGLWLARENDFVQAIDQLKKFIDTPSLPASLVQYKDAAQVTLARTLYGIQKWKESIEEFKKLNKDSNYTVRAVAEMSWANLMMEQYGDSVGTAMNLEKGGFKNTFSPEGLVVSAMALNELCQFPSSLRAAQNFKKRYRPVYHWLKEWYQKSRAKPYYDALVDYVDTGKTTIPLQVITNWSRSPVFLSHQQELNLIGDEKRKIEELFRSQASEYNTLRKELSEQAAELKKAQKSGAKDAEAVKEFNQRKARFDSYRKTLLVLKDVERGIRGMVPEIKRALVGEINREISRMNLLMIRKLKDHAENIRLLEVDIYSGASQDIVWQNANPEYQEYKTEKKKELIGDQSKVFNWGPPQRSDSGDVEIWEDEVGALTASLFDNCSNKEKYLSVVIKREKSE